MGDLYIPYFYDNIIWGFRWWTIYLFSILVMKRFAKKIVVLVILVFVLDISLGYVLENFYFNQSKGKLFRISNVLENVNSEVLIFGSSRAVHHYNPAIIERELGFSTFNAGLDGQSIIYHKIVFDAIISRYKPKLIVLELYEDMDFSFSNNQYDRLSVLLPYINKYPEIKLNVQKRSYFEKIKMLSKTYPYNSLILRMIEGNFNFTNSDKSSNGFIANEGYWINPIKKVHDLQSDYDEKKVKYFYDFVKKCRENKIPLFVVISPIFQNCADCFSFSKEICDIAGVKLHNFSSEIIFLNDKNNFEDPLHLNFNGAQIYSEFISPKLKDFLK